MAETSTSARKAAHAASPRAPPPKPACSGPGASGVPASCRSTGVATEGSPDAVNTSGVSTPSLMRLSITFFGASSSAFCVAFEVGNSRSRSISVFCRAADSFFTSAVSAAASAASQASTTSSPSRVASASERAWRAFSTSERSARSSGSYFAARSAFT